MPYSTAFFPFNNMPRRFPMVGVRAPSDSFLAAVDTHCWEGSLWSLHTPLWRDTGYFPIFTITNHTALNIWSHSLLPTLVRSQVGLRIGVAEDWRGRGWTLREGRQPGSFWWWLLPPLALFKDKVPPAQVTPISATPPPHPAPSSPLPHLQQSGKFWNLFFRRSTLLFSWGE